MPEWVKNKNEVTVGMTGNTENIKTTNELSNEKKERNDPPSLERTSSENESMKNGGTTLKTLQANKSPEVDLTKPPRGRKSIQTSVERAMAYEKISHYETRRSWQSETTPILYRRRLLF